MDIKLSNQEVIYLYGNLKKELNELKSIKQKSLMKSDIQFHEKIIDALESAMPQLKTLPF